MTADFQTYAALGLVALAAAWLLWRKIKPGRKSGCGQDCACPKPNLDGRNSAR